MATFEIQNEVRKVEYRYIDEQNSVEASGSAEFKSGKVVRHISGSVYMKDGQDETAYKGTFSVTGQPDGTINSSYNPRNDEDLDVLRTVKQAVVVRLTETGESEE